MNSTEGLSVIIPVYNEQDGSICETVNSISKLLEDNLNCDFEIIAVNDGSTDRTIDILEGLETSFQLISHDKNRGYGAAIKTGIQHASYGTIAITDADGTYPNHLMSDFYHILKEENLDMIVAKRPFRALPRKTWLAKFLLNKLADYITGRKIPDINSGLRLFKKRSFTPFIPIIPNGFSLTTTITLGMFMGGYNVKYVPIEYSKRKGNSKIKPVRDTLNFINLIMKIGLYFAPLKVFMPVAIALFLMGVTWAIVSWLFGRLADVSSLVIIMSSFQLGAMAILAELINHRTPNYYKKQDDADENHIDQSPVN
jgi:glycosyltransferase involved in cell wall biosynthesis